MSYYNNAIKMRPYIERAVASLPDAEALEVPTLFPSWAAGTSYETGERAEYGGLLYKCLQIHTAQADWTPDAAQSLWAKVLIPDTEIVPEWEQPESTNPYAKGDKVRHNGKVWISDLDGNIWEPGVYGWEESEG